MRAESAEAAAERRGEPLQGLRLQPTNHALLVISSNFTFCRSREHQASLVRAEAAKVAAERRGEPLQGFRLQDGLPGVFAWQPAPPVAGSTATLAYNKAQGALR